MSSATSALSARPIEPAPSPLAARINVPGSKSLTNRALMVAALADGQTTITNALFSDDSRFFSECLSKLGYRLAMEPEARRITVWGQGGRVPARQAELFVGNAGTAARFLTALVSVGHGEYVVDGNARMRQRPIGDLLAALRQLGVEVDSPTGCPPVRIRTAGLCGGRAVVRGDVSSQFLSGLLLASPSAQSDVEITVDGELASKPYVEMTLRLMAQFGVAVERTGYESFSVRPQAYQPQAAYPIESDASAASYFFAAPAVAGGWVRVENIRRGSLQGDVGFLDVLEAMGCNVEAGPDWITVSGPRNGLLRGVEVDMRHMPDTALTLAAVAPFATTLTTIRGIATSRVKETDRIAAPCAELRRLGVRVDEFEDGLTIYPASAIRPATVETYNDHRMAMSFALVGLGAPGVAISDPGCVAKTFPDFWDVWDGLYGRPTG
jgi:3-phosphoshikimate 1-carboxyvinyltransferase